MARYQLSEAEIAISEMIAQLVFEKLRTHAERPTRLIGREKMAELANLSTATLDRLVSSGSISSVLLRGRRLFDPRKVLGQIVELHGEAQKDENELD